MGTQVSLFIFIQWVLHTKACYKSPASSADNKEQQAACSGVPVSTLFEVILSWSIYKTATVYSQGKSHVVFISLFLKDHFSWVKWQSKFPLSFLVVLRADACSLALRVWTRCCSDHSLPLMTNLHWGGLASLYTV